MPTLPDFIQLLDHGVHVVDTGFLRPRFDASYLIVENGRGAFVDTGTNHSVPRLLDAIDAVGLALDSVDFVIATHVHLDHAGGAGLLLSKLPRARLVVHPRGAPHLMDPSRLVAGARAVYGEAEVERSYGNPVGVPADRVVQSTDGMVLDFAGRPLRFLDTPGHARHHHCIWDEKTQGFFSGDTFGVSYPEFDTPAGPWILPTTPPVQFDPPALRRSIEKLLAFRPACMYLTHYGRVTTVEPLAALLLGQIDSMVELANTVRESPRRHEALKAGLAEIHRKSLLERGSTLPREQIETLLAVDLELNAQGLGVWLDRPAR